MGSNRRAAAKALAFGLIALTISALVLGALGAIGATAQTGSQGATLDQAGWWSQANAVPAEPAPGVTLPVTVTAPPPPSVPAGTMAVGATAGATEKISAVGIVPSISAGTVSSAILTIPEATAGQQVNNTAPETAIVACPIMSFWVGGENSQWGTQPPYDCTTAKAAGIRGPDGVWKWDFTTIAAKWLDGSLPANGVMLVPDVVAPSTATFQLVLTRDVTLMGVAIDATAGTTTTTVRPTTTAGTSGGGGGGGTTGGSGSGGGPVGTTPAPTTTQPAGTATTEAAAPAAPEVDLTNATKIFGNLPGGTLLLLPVVLAIAVLLMIAYGPLGEPALGAGREGGVSRALAARERADRDRATPTPALEAP